MRLTTKGRYAVRAVANLAAVRENRPVSISQISEEEDVSPEFLEQIFFKLKKAGIISSLRGPKGGFVLNRKPAAITIKMILDAVGEPVYPAPCTDVSDSTGCPRHSHCSTSKIWRNLYVLIDQFLSGVTLQDILEDVSGAHLASLGTAGQKS